MQPGQDQEVAAPSPSLPAGTHSEGEKQVAAQSPACSEAEQEIKHSEGKREVAAESPACSEAEQERRRIGPDRTRTPHPAHPEGKK